MYRQTATRKAKTGNGPSSASDTGQRIEQHIPEWKNDWMGAWTRGSPLFASGASEMENGNNSRQTRSYSPISPEIPDIWAASQTPESDHAGYTQSPANHNRRHNRIRSAQEGHDQFGYSNWDTRDGPLRDRMRRDYENSNERRSMGQFSPWSPQIERATGTPENGNDERPQWWLYSPRSPGTPDCAPTHGTPETVADSPPRQRNHSLTTTDTAPELHRNTADQETLYSLSSGDVRLTSDYIEHLQIAVERIEEACRQTAENKEKAPEAVPKTPKYEFNPGDYTLDESFSEDEVILFGDTPPQGYEQPFGKGRKNVKLLNIKHEISAPGREASRQRTYIPRSPITCGSPANSVLDPKRRKHRKRKHSHHHHHHRGHSKSHKKARTDTESDAPPKKSFLDRVPRQRPFPTETVETEKRNRERNTPPWRRTENSLATNWNRGQLPKAVAIKVATPPREKAFLRGAGEAEKKDQQRNTPPWRRTEINWRNPNTNRRGRGEGTGRWNVDKDNLSRYIPVFSPHRLSRSGSRSIERSKGSNKTSIEKPPKPTDNSDRRSYSRSPRFTNFTSNWNRGLRPKPDTKFATAPRERAFQRGARDTEKKDQQRNTPPWRRPENIWRNSITNRRGRGGGPGSRGVERDRQNIRYMGSNKNSNLEPSKPIDHFGRRSYSRSPRSTSP